MYERIGLLERALDISVASMFPRKERLKIHNGKTGSDLIRERTHHLRIMLRLV
jgi:hypothetical protein